MMTVPQIMAILNSLEEIDKLTPKLAANYQLFLSAHIYEAGIKIIEAEQIVNARWQELRNIARSDKDADKAASLTDEWKEYKKAVFAEKTLIETIRSLKKMLKVFEEEARNQH